MDELELAKQRIISASLRVAHAERGGLDQVNAADELELAHATLDVALQRYVDTLIQSEGTDSDTP